MVGIHSKTQRLPVQFLIYIAITALSRYLVIDVQQVSGSFHLYLLLSNSTAIVALSLAVLILSYSGRRYGMPEQDAAALAYSKSQGEQMDRGHS